MQGFVRRIQVEVNKFRKSDPDYTTKVLSSSYQSLTTWRNWFELGFIGGGAWSTEHRRAVNRDSVLSKDR